MQTNKAAMLRGCKLNKKCIFWNLTKGSWYTHYIGKDIIEVHISSTLVLKQASVIVSHKIWLSNHRKNLWQSTATEAQGHNISNFNWAQIFTPAQSQTWIRVEYKLKPDVAWENSWHFATSPLISPRNDVWETKAEIPYWWRDTIQIWVVTRHHYGISALVSQTSFRG